MCRAEVLLPDASGVGTWYEVAQQEKQFPSLDSPHFTSPELVLLPLTLIMPSNYAHHVGNHDFTRATVVIIGAGVSGTA